MDSYVYRLTMSYTCSYIVVQSNANFNKIKCADCSIRVYRSFQSERQHETLHETNINFGSSHQASVKYVQKFTQNAFKNFHMILLMLHINILVLCSIKNNTDVKILLLECSIRVFMIRGQILHECSNHRSNHYNTVLICTDCSIREYRFDCSLLCWHNMLAY